MELLTKLYVDRLMKLKRLQVEKQIDFCAQLAGEGDPTKIAFPAIYQPKHELELIEKSGINTRLLIVFYNYQGGTLNLNLVFGDEYYPLSDRVDQMYREQREKEYGRTKDIESVCITPDNQITFPRNFATTEPYNTARHAEGAPWRSYEGKIYSSTWNHLLHTREKYWPAFWKGYKKIDAPFREGDREDAESWAK